MSVNAPVLMKDFSTSKAIDLAEKWITYQEHTDMSGTTLKTLKAVAGTMNKTTRSALGTLALVELLGKKAVRQISTEEVWRRHRKALLQLGIDIGLKTVTT